MTLQTVTVQTEQTLHVCNWCKEPIKQSEAAWNSWLELDDELDLHDACLEKIARKAVDTVYIDV